MGRQRQDDHLEEARLLLPWYITGRLAETERKLVESMLGRYPELKQEYEHEMTVVSLIRENAGLLHLTALDTTEQRLNKLMKQIGREQQANLPKQVVARPAAPAGIAAPPFSLLDRLKGWLPKADWLTPANVVFASLLAIQAGLLGWYMQANAPSKAGVENIYLSASVADHQTAVPVVTGMVLLVDFNEDAQIKQVRHFLNQWNARILDGPDANNLFKIEVKDVPEADKRSDAVVQQMQQEPKVVAFVGRYSTL